MRFLGGVPAAVFMGFFTLRFGLATSSGLPDSMHVLVPAALAAFGSCVGFLVGATIVGRASRDVSQLPVFAALTAGIGGGLVGLVVCVSTLSLYIVTYTAWPDGMLDRVLYVLAFPALGSLGFFVGAMLWSVVGLAAGGALKLVKARS